VPLIALDIVPLSDSFAFAIQNYWVKKPWLLLPGLRY
jgi:hypothetical protein